MKVCLMTFNAKYIHKALALRWLYVARDPEHDVEIVEYTIRDSLPRCLADMVARKPDVVACSTYIWNVEIMKEWIVMLKEALPEVRIILGGPEVSFEAKSWLQYPIECVLRGEGEITLWQAINREKNIDGYLSLEYTSSIAYAKVPLDYLESLESPYFLEQDLNEMAYRYFYFETSRGCPYRCAYCLSSIDNQVRFFSQQYLFNQLKQLQKYPVKQVKLLDRTFNANNQFSYQFVQFIEQLNLSTSFQFEVVADTLSDRMLQFLMEEATVWKYRFEIGIQSFHQPTLKAVNRTQNLQRCKEVIQQLTQKGYSLHVDLIGGLPYEDIQQFECSYNELFSIKAKEIQVGLLKLLKGTALKAQAEQFQIRYDEQAPYTVKQTQWLSSEDIETIENVYHATEKLYNSGRCFYALHALNQELNKFSPFSVLARCGALMKMKKQIQVDDYFLILYQAIHPEQKDQKKVKAILLNDYCRLFKQRTKKLFDWPIEKTLKDKIYQNCIEMGLLHEQEVYNYTDLSWGWFNHQCIVQMLVYNSKQTLPQRILFDDKEGKVILDERNLDRNHKCS